MTLVKLHRTAALHLFIAVGFLTIALSCGAVEESTGPQRNKPIDPELAIKQFTAPANFKISLYASEPQLQNPVAFCFDEHDNIYVAETFRYHTSVLDIRNYMTMYYDDLANRNVDDRIKTSYKYFGSRATNLAGESEVIRKLEDKAGTGKADNAVVYAEGFNTMLDGIGAGVLSRKGKLYYTCIPELWMLQDTNNSDHANLRTSFAHGFGVRFGFTGHDLHGLRIGPDGKLYFTIGDRALNVTNLEGKVLSYPEAGCALRCNQDGTDMEIYAYGLRNPQSLAFDDYGNLFTGDNNCDHGDAARIVYVAEGGDSGWRTAHQFSETTPAGVWNSEKLWALQYPEQAAWVLPPIAHVGDGPSGFAHYPGTGFPASYKDHFFMCDFRGASVNSGVHSMSFKPKGAGFELVDESHFFWHILVTDCQFSSDGQLYVSDWVRGWPQSQLGRIYRLYDPEIIKSTLVQETKKLISEGMEKRSATELETLLAHPDQRVRQEAQFEIVDRATSSKANMKDRGDYAALLLNTAKKSTNQLARLHGIWGLGQIGRLDKSVLTPALDLLNDPDSEVRAQTVKIFGEDLFAMSFGGLTNALTDSNLRVRYFAAISLGKLGNSKAIKPLVAVLKENADKDVFLRHACVMGLVGTADKPVLVSLATNESRSVRMAVLLAMRRLELPEVATFLDDKDQLIVLEAARVINDLPLNDALPKLAAMISHPTGNERTDWRILNANNRVGRPENAINLAIYASESKNPDWLRGEAVRALGDWESPFFRDRITGQPRPLAPRDASVAVTALTPGLKKLISDSPAEVAKTALDAVASLRITSVGDLLLSTASDKKAPPSVRVQALKTLAALDGNKIPGLITMAMADESELVRSSGYWLQAKTRPDEASAKFATVLESGTTLEKQTLLDAMGTLESDATDKLIAGLMDKLQAGTLPKDIQLNLLEAAEKRNSPLLKSKLTRYQMSLSPKDDLAIFRECLFGGDAEAGSKAFRERQDIACNRCHKISGSGGNVGPDLTGISKRRDREYILESIVYPNKQIAEGFENLTVTLKSGRSIAGIVRGQTESEIKLFSSEDNEEIVVKKSDIVTQNKGQSPMPEGLMRMMNKRDLRNIIEFVATSN